MCYKKQNKLYPADKLGPLTRHHRKCRSHGGKHEGDNISFIPEKLHNAHHLLYANNTPAKIAEILNEHYLDQDYFMVAVPKDKLGNVMTALLSKSSQ